MTEFDAETMASFMMEFRECIEESIRLVVRLEDNPQETESVHALFRNLHNIKGNASVLELEKISSLSHEAETLLDSIREGAVQITEDIIETLLKTADTITALLDEIEGRGSVDQSELNDLVNAISSYLPRKMPEKEARDTGGEKRVNTSVETRSHENKILIVDDEEAIIRLFQKVFDRADYEIRSAGSAEEALDILREENIHVMFTDLNLPGMNGMELCRRILKDKPIAIIYAMTGYVSLFELADCLEAGFADYFVKPFNTKVILKAAEDAFEKLHRWRKQ
jgi:CheY-like chemotaxis protein/HPt (histidine-containing phosphotransfer) domain-containing protein